MRVRVIFAIICGLLFCTLVALEFPELMNLTDDTSNDYSLVIFRSCTGNVIEKGALDSARGTGIKRPKTEDPLTRILPRTPSCEIPEVLHLLCIQRI